MKLKRPKKNVISPKQNATEAGKVSKLLLVLLAAKLLLVVLVLGFVVIVAAASLRQERPRRFDP